jgi:sulfur carrier protein ThiS
MKVKVRFLGFPELIPLKGEQGIEWEFSGETLKDLLKTLKTRYPESLKEFQVFKNNQYLGSPDAPNEPIREGDTLTLVSFVDGG